MNKLTKEQAAWLIEKFKANGLGKNPDGGYYVMNLLNVEEIINQCTEQEFPEFEIKLGEFDSKSYLKIKETYRGFLLQTILGDIYLKNIEFKQFTQGCQKIVDWLNTNQEN